MDEVTAEMAKAQADMAMATAIEANGRSNAVLADVERVSRTASQALAKATLAEGKVENFQNSTVITTNSLTFRVDQLDEGHHDLNMALSETNERLETLELMMQLQTTAPIAAATDAEAELVDQLITAESSLEAANNALDAALQLIYDIRKRARETGAMNTNEWMDLGQRSVAMLELHKLI